MGSAEPTGLLRGAEWVDRGTLDAFRDEGVRRLVERSWATNPFYRRRWQRVGVIPERVRTVADIRRLPLVRKADFEADLREHPPFGEYQGDWRAVRVQASSGSFGQPKPFFQTAHDWEAIALLWRRRLAAQGVRPGDLVQIAFTYSLFIPGFTATEGAMRLGATVIPAGSGAVTGSERQIELARRWGSTVLGCTGSYALRLAEVAEALGCDPARDFRFRLMFHTAEPLTAESRAAIEARWGCRSYDNYGSVETGAPTWECEAQDGLHISEDAYHFEIVDPESGEPLPPGEEGEVVVTSLFREAAPVIRYRTGDIAALLPEPCSCGRTLLRLSPIRGRLDEMFKVRGVALYPSAIDRVLRRFGEIGSCYRIVLDREGELDRLVLQIEHRLREEEADPLAARLAQAVKAQLGVTPVVQLRPLGGWIPPEEADRWIKSRRVLDLRESGAPDARRPGWGARGERAKKEDDER